MWILSLVAVSTSHGCSPPGTGGPGSVESGGSGGSAGASSGSGASSSDPGRAAVVRHAAAWGEGRIRAAALSGDGASTAVATSLGTAVHRTEGFERVWFQPSNGWVVSVGFSGDGRRVISGANHGRATVRDAATGEEIRTLAGKGRMQVALDATGRRAAVADDTPAVTLWDLDTGEAVRAWPGSERSFSEVRFSPDGAWLAAADRGGAVRVWALSGDGAERALVHGKPAVHAIAFHPSAPRLASAGKGWIVWDLESGAQVSAARAPGILRSVGWSGDGERLVTGSDRNRAFVWNAGTGERLHTLALHQDAVIAAGFVPGHGERLMLASDKLHLVDVGAAAVVRALPVSGPVLEIVHAGEIVAVRDRQQVVIRRVADGAPLHALDGHTDPVEAIGFSADGKVLLSHSSAEVIRWDPGTGARQRLLAAGAQGLGRVGGAALSPDGALVATAAEVEDRGKRHYRIDLLDARSGERRRTLATVPSRALSGVQALAFSPDGSMLAARTADSAIVWEVSSGDETLRVDEVARNPAGAVWIGGARLAVATRAGDVGIWDARSGREAVSLGRVDGTPGVLAVSRDGRWLAAGVRATGGDQVIVWDASAGKRVHARLPGAGRIVHALGFSPDGALLAAGCTRGETGGLLAVWSVAAGAAVPVDARPAAPVRAVAFLGDDALLTGTTEGGLDLWAVTR